MMDDAERHGYAVGYFECWNLESLLAVTDAAQALRSPVILGFSGIYLTHPDRVAHDPLALYAALGRAACANLSVPACLLFNECPRPERVSEAIECGFDLVMLADDTLESATRYAQVAAIVEQAHAAGTAVEGEVAALEGVGGELAAVPRVMRLTDPGEARFFVERTGVDALAINVGQAHMHGRVELDLDVERISALRDTLHVPLVLHGATSVSKASLREVVRRGIRKINVGSALKRAYAEALRRACAEIGNPYNPYEVVGSGLTRDVLMAARLAMRQVVEGWMVDIGSAGKG
jgi:fructose/tagatose bisphosphate aldolase